MPSSSAAVALRDARPDDFAAVAAIYADAVLHGTASFETEAPDAAEMTRRHSALAAAGFPWIVAEAAGEILGYGYFGFYRTRPAYRFTVENSVYVAPAAKRRGVGRLLLAELIGRAERAGFRRMIAVIGDGGNAASIGLHGALGFAPVGVLPSVGWKHGRWLDSVLMQRPLGDGDETPPIEPAAP